jgi:putative oxidoreductase
MNSQFTSIVRVVLAFLLLVFGLNKFFAYIPLPELPEAAAGFMESLKSSTYMLQVVGGLEIIIGLMLLAKKWIAFALLLLAPLTLNILLFHLFLDLSGLFMALIMATLNTILIYKHWPQYKPLFN